MSRGNAIRYIDYVMRPEINNEYCAFTMEFTPSGKNCWRERHYTSSNKIKCCPICGNPEHGEAECKNEWRYYNQDELWEKLRSLSEYNAGYSLLTFGDGDFMPLVAINDVNYVDNLFHSEGVPELVELTGKFEKLKNEIDESVMEAWNKSEDAKHKNNSVTLVVCGIVMIILGVACLYWKSPIVAAICFFFGIGFVVPTDSK